ncbi:hypothetical protein FQ775_10030 [Nitratireductor mangrovi]|uniref:DUF6460 domain-containing protein n=1 Tax=Nitratireductor mangrovi TaxID=2599600 RepID=A0A5B8KYK2_9HYPH|nr:DUF6460 domain-containing protein [Nitratireductor mangrovi]QDZ00693.1 hypothetical protein FQ775_10030 [Nitratireductor mangrovi]
MSGSITRFLGDSPLRVVVKLAVVSFLVGIVMNAFGWSPLDVWYALREMVLDIWNMGFAALGRFGEYLALGAAVVIPAFIVLRILSLRR